MSEDGPYDWVVLWCEQLEAMVVLPVDDIMSHRSGDLRCWCTPMWCDDVLVHHAGDNRPQFRRLAA